MPLMGNWRRSRWGRGECGLKEVDELPSAHRRKAEIFPDTLLVERKQLREEDRR